MMCMGKDLNLNACFGNGDGLLLHSLVNGHLVLGVHLVKLINAADTIVSQHESTRLYAELTSVAVLQDTRPSAHRQLQATDSHHCPGRHITSMCFAMLLI